MNNSRCDTWCIAGLTAILGSIVLGALFSLLFTGFGLMFFGVVFVLGVVTFGIGLVMRRVSPKAEAS